jgi:hypothetical protein
MLRDYLERVLGSPVPALLEHRDFGLPDAGSISAFFEATGYAAVWFGHGNTDVWLLMMLTYHTLRVADGVPFVTELNRRFNLEYATNDWSPPHYRTCFLLSKQHSADALESLKASLQQVPGPQGSFDRILRLCQTILLLTQGGRLVRDKDRHITNLEHLLSHECRAAAAGLQHRLASIESVMRAERHGLTQAVQDVRDQLAALEGALEQERRVSAKDWDEWRREVAAAIELWPAELRRGFEESRSEIGRLASGLERIARLVSAALDSQRAELYGIYKDLDALQWQLTRMVANPGWRAVAALSALALRLRPRREVPSAVELICDDPAPGARVGGPFVVRGWALASSGIEAVTVEVDGRPAAPARVGLLRPDVAAVRPGILAARRCGYECRLDGLEPGAHRLSVRAVSREGAVGELLRDFEVDGTAGHTGVVSA